MAEPRKLTDDITVNDGGGLFDSEGLIDTLIVDCNDLTGFLTSGRYVKFCSAIVSMVQKLGALKQGIKDQKAADDQRYNDMKNQLDDLMKKTGFTGGDGNGVEH